MDKEIVKTVEQILLDKIRNKQTIYYSELASEIDKKIGKKVVPEGRFMGVFLSKYLQFLCRKYFEEKNLMIGAIVVNKKYNLPSEGFFKFAETLYNKEFENENQKINFWKSEINKIFKEIK